MPSQSAALIFYRPENGKTKQKVFYNDEAWLILSRPASQPGGNTASFPDLNSLCSKWKALLDETIESTSGVLKPSDEAGIIDFLQSGKRRYAIRGSILSGYPTEQEKEKQYIFILERFSPDKLNLAMIFRQWNLSDREKDIVRLLLEGKSNKEIAHNLALTLNTVKSYMKLLSRKTGISGRTHIVSRLVGGKKAAGGGESRRP